MDAGEIHRADPRQKGRLLWIAAGTCALAVVALLYLQWELAAIRFGIESGKLDTAMERFYSLVRLALCLLGLVGAAAGVSIGYSSWRVHREQRYPHSGARLMHDMPVVRGSEAARMSRIGFALATAFVLLAILGTAWGWRLLAQPH